jgi:hypothetical protein
LIVSCAVILTDPKRPRSPPKANPPLAEIYFKIDSSLASGSVRMTAQADRKSFAKKGDMSMKSRLAVSLSLAVLMVSLVGSGFAQQEGPSAPKLRNTIRGHIEHQEKLQGAFAVVDERSGELRRLELVRVHERVGKTGDYYYSCTDMKDVDSGDELDLDFDVEDKDGELNVVDIRIHKDNGNPRYTYDDNDNMIPISETADV